jgi:hypothetical protein
MADTKISALTAATTPLAGTEVLPIVQSGTTVKVPVSSLTSGRAVSMANLLLQGATLPAAGNPSIALRSSDNTVYHQSGSANAIVFLDKDQNTMAIIDKTNGVAVYGANFVVGTSGKGIDFSATPGTGTSELLADYEEGTWTPADGSGAGLTFTDVEGAYTKVGRLITCFFTLTFPTTVDGSSARISGLPFTVPSGTSGLNDGIFTVNTSGLVVQPFATNNATNFSALLTYTGSGATNVQLTAVTLRGSISYSV